MLRILAVVVFIVTVHADPATGAEFTATEVRVTIGGKTLLDAPNSEPKNSHVYIYFGGDAARETYNAMIEPPVEDECLSDGSEIKVNAGMSCTKSLIGGYQCAVGVNLQSQHTELSQPCYRQLNIFTSLQVV